MKYSLTLAAITGLATALATGPVEETRQRRGVGLSTNWAGASKTGTKLSSVEGTIVIPAYTADKNESKTAVSAWVGIDGQNKCPDGNSLLQTGVDIHSSGRIAAWVEFYPADSIYLHHFKINAGDEIKMSIDVKTPTKGSATLENLTTGKSVTKHLKTDKDTPLCQGVAEWIVEDYKVDGSKVPLLDFGNLTISNAKATDGNNTVDVSSAKILDLVNDDHNKLFIKCSATGSDVLCSYVNSA